MVHRWHHTNAQHRQKRSGTTALRRRRLRGQVQVLPVVILCHRPSSSKKSRSRSPRRVVVPPPPASPSGFKAGSAAVAAPVLPPWQDPAAYPKDYHWMICAYPNNLDCRFWTVIPEDEGYMYPGSWTIWWQWKETRWTWRWMRLNEYLKKINIDNL